MGKAPSPTKRGAHGGASNGSSGGSGNGSSGSGHGSSASSSTGASGGDEMLLTERTERVESTVVSRENATHAAFAASRTRGFPYAATSQYIHLLNDYCNQPDVADAPGSTGSGSSSILVVVGPPGTGKSSLLAHWASLRRASDDGAHEFIYEHYCGCSFDSVKLSLFLFRLMNQLKITFALRDFELPREHEEEKLKFSFARCLEAAVGRTNQRAGGGGGPSSKRRTIVLILDGIDCIRTEDGGDSLSWLPNAFPPGVRIIVSANHSAARPLGKTALLSARAVTRKPVVYDDDGDLIYDTSLPPSESDSHTIRELRRRRVSFIVVEPLDETACRAILYLYKRTAIKSPLSRDEQNAIVAAPGSANPLFLRLMLEGQELFDPDSAGRSTWLERATRVGEIHGVYELLIRRWNEILLEDLNEQLHKLTAPPEHPETNTTTTHKLVRRGTKRDVTAAAAAGDSTTNTLVKDGSPQAAHGPGPHTLMRTPSIRSSAASHHNTSGPDPAELENLHVAMEQRVLLVRHTLSLLAVSRYGLSETDLQRLLGDAVPRAVCHRLLGLLAPHLMQIRRRDCGSGSGSGPTSTGDEVVLLDLSHNQLRLLVRYGFLQDDHMRACYYKELATYFSGLDASQRRIDELPVQLERCGLWSALQATLVDIKMFQLWWAERNRQEFFSYWMVLRSNCSIHDPVDDFIRSLDEYVAHENPSAEQLLALCLTITDFLRAWQRIDDSRSGQLALARPAPPQLNEFISSLGGFFSTTHLAEHEAKKVQSEIDALCIHKDDAYFVRRWLWTQFPLLAVAFECRFLRSLLAGKSSASSPALDSSTTTKHDDSSSSTSEGSTKAPSSSSQPSGSGSASFGKKAVVVLPKSFDKGKSHSPLKPAKRKPSLLFGSNNSEATDDGAFEFLSTENTELTVGSVSKFETQLMELRMRYDKLKFTAKAKRDVLAALESRLLDVRAQARAAGQSASQVDELLEQIRQIGDETQLGRQRGDYYKAILRHCEVHPARDPNAIEVTETAVNKMKQEIVELQQKTQVASYEVRLASVESKKLHHVITDKTQIHNTALERLRWRFELLQRMMVQQRKAATTARRDAVDAAKRSLLPRGESSEEEDDDEDNDDDDEDDDDHDGNNGSGDGAQRRRRRQSRKASAVVDEQATQFNRAKDKLLHKKETSLERLRKVESLKVYVGSAFKDDGVLGALRQVGINKPEEAQLYWQDQQQHATQLEAEEKSLEQRVADYRDKLASLQSQLLNLKLGGSSAASSDVNSGGGGAGASSPANALSGSTAGAGAGGSGASGSNSGSAGDVASAVAGAAGGASHNLKQLEQQLGDALAVMQQKKDRAARIKSLSERLHLGLHHVAHILGVHVTQQMESSELADAVEQVVRLYLGDEGHMQSTSATNLRRKNSVRAMGMATQSGLHAIAPPDTRSTDEKLRFNIRVSKSPQRQMNPYVDGDAVGAGVGVGGDGGDKEGDDDDEEDDEEEDDGGDTASGQRHSPHRSNQPDTVEAVTRRADIKNRARVEVDRKLRTPVAKQPRAKASSTDTAVAAAAKPRK